MKAPFTVHNLFIAREARRLFFFLSVASPTLLTIGVLCIHPKIPEISEQEASSEISRESIYENSNVECPKCEPFNKHSGSKIDKNFPEKKSLGIPCKVVLFFG